MKVAHVETFDDNGIGKVLNFYGDEKFAPDTMTLYEVTTEEQVVEKFGKMAEMYFDKNSSKLFYRYIDRPLNQSEQIELMQMTADDKYKVLDLLNATLDEVKSAKIAQLKELCTLAIYDGFTSSIGHSFGFNELDQANFTQQSVLIVLDSLADTDTIQWKTVDAGVVDVTIAQFKTVIGEAKDHKLAEQTKYWQLEAQVNAATTNTEVDVINW